METKTARILALNDEMRHNLIGGTAVITTGVAALGPEAVARIVKTIEVYDDFCHANDPHEEHDFGAFNAGGKRVFFKIDYFDESVTVHSPDHSDPKVTHHHAGRGILTTTCKGPVAGLVGIEGGVVSGVINLESSGVRASDWRPRHDEHYHEV